MQSLRNCWEIMQCGRQAGGSHVGDLGECIASRERMGHSCWVIAGTMCGGAVECTEAKKRATCMACPVYKNYDRLAGAMRAEVRMACSDEDKRYYERLNTTVRTARA